MKRAVVAGLCVVLASLCACGRITPEEETTITTTIPETTQAASTEELTSETAWSSQPTVTIKTNKDDPHSFVVDEYLNYYNERLNDKNSGMRPHYYALYDMDGNGIKELLIAELYAGDIRLYDIFAIQNGEAVRQEEFLVDTEKVTLIAIYEDGTIKTRHGYRGDQMALNYFRFESGILRLKTGLGEDYGVFNHYDYASKTDTLISKEEFELLEKKFDGNGQIVELDWKPLAEYGR